MSPDNEKDTAAIEDGYVMVVLTVLIVLAVIFCCGYAYAVREFNRAAPTPQSCVDPQVAGDITEIKLVEKDGGLVVQCVYHNTAPKGLGQQAWKLNRKGN